MSEKVWDFTKGRVGDLIRTERWSPVLVPAIFRVTYIDSAIAKLVVVRESWQDGVIRRHIGECDITGYESHIRGTYKWEVVDPMELSVCLATFLEAVQR